MSDVMLFGVLRMPYDMAMATQISRHQYWQRGQEAADRIEALEKTLRKIISLRPDPEFGTPPLATAQKIARKAFGVKDD